MSEKGSMKSALALNGSSSVVALGGFTAPKAHSGDNSSNNNSRSQLKLNEVMSNITMNIK
mgnify:CR=1 FL=1